tara:strand:+ start:220 stop:426 length:207 start_codon:yes stop_codon:yes gene_type:complete
MKYNLSEFIEKNSDAPELNSAFQYIEHQIEALRNYSYSVPFESEPSEFLKFLSCWQSKKDKSKDDHEG